VKKVILLHGFGSNPTANWFPWLKNELAKIDTELNVLTLPNSRNPRLSEWLEQLELNLPEVTDEVLLIGHSVGGSTILRYLEKTTQPVKAVFLVATPVKPIPMAHLHVLDNFLVPDFKFEKIRSNAGHVVAIYAQDDDRVNITNGRTIRDTLGADYTELSTGGHLNQRSGILELPILLEKIVPFL
jgi:predicted alpha/beta hydrolase family esterase